MNRHVLYLKKFHKTRITTLLIDEEGNETLEHHVHDIEFAGDKIKKINVYSRLKENKED